MNDILPFATQGDDFPRDGDKLFTNEGDWSSNAILTHGNQWVGYVDGFKLGADLLMQHIAEAGSNQDYLVYPIVFMYRQCIELQLKRIIFTGCKITGLEREHKSTEHGLLPLWRECRKLIELRNNGKSPDFMKVDEAEKLIVQFHNRDSKSTTFRYPYRLGEKLIPTHDQATKNINLENFTINAGRLYSTLESCTTWFEGDYDAMCQMQSDCQS